VAGEVRPVVACRGLAKAFGDVRVVSGLDLEVTAGSIVGLIGPSGSGKTTTVRLLTGLLRPTEGEATVWGTPAVDLRPRQRQEIGYMPQTSALFPDLSLWENLSFHASMYGLRLRRRHRLRRVLDWVELADDRDKTVRQSSGGMQRRLALAAAFVHDPALLFLDEPTAGIDPILRSSFWERFRAMRDEGRTMIVTTQYVAEAAYCDYVGLLSDGELLVLASPEELRKAAFDGEVVEIELARPVDPASGTPLRDVPGAAGAVEAIDSRTWRLVVDDADAAIGPVEEMLDRLGLPVVEVREHVVDFDEAFVQLVARHRDARVPDGAALAGASASAP
jgi:ABC-2 type transport system ATP-binding protein